MSDHSKISFLSKIRCKIFGGFVSKNCQKKSIQNSPNNKASRPFRYIALVMQILEKILGTRFSLHGLEKIEKIEKSADSSILFVANHFTRSETFFLPYLLYKITGKQVRCLADHHIFVGVFGRFLRSVGAISTKELQRDKIILSDLISGENRWMIYPEGSMIKSKEIKELDKESELFLTSTPSRTGPVRTGSAVLALKSQLYRQEIIKAFDKGDYANLEELQQDLDVKFNENLRSIQTWIVPVSITYYPIRPGKNVLQNLITRLVKNIPNQISEELQIEGNLLLSANIDVYLGEPINIADYSKSTTEAINQIPIIKAETKINLAVRYLRTRLSQDFMAKIYHDIQLNFDHLFVAALWHLEQGSVRLSTLKRTIYYSSVLIQKTRKYRVHASLYESNLFKLFSDETHRAFDDVFTLALNQEIVFLKNKVSANGTSGNFLFSDSDVIINKDKLANRSNFHQIRLENTLQVVANEFLLLSSANQIVKKVAKIDDETLRQLVFNEIRRHDLENFDIDYEANFDPKFSKEKTVGEPFYLDSTCKSSVKIRKLAAIVVHGYKAAPKETEFLAKNFNGFGIRVYGVRLKGHGTAPADMKNVSWQDWYESLQRGYCALANIANKIILVGFSTGGLLCLTASSFKRDFSHKLAAVISINSALKLRNIKARMVPGITWWNELLEKLSVEKGRIEYVDDSPENPHINYSRNYLHGVYELEKLMEICSLNLERITIPALIIQGKDDGVVDPSSGRTIFDKIKSKEKTLRELDFANHVIIAANGKEEVFGEIIEFLGKAELI